MDKYTVPLVCAVVLAILAFSVSTMAFYKDDTQKEIDYLKTEIQDLKYQQQAQHIINEDQELFNENVAEYIVINTELWDKQMVINENVLILLGLIWL